MQCFQKLFEFLGQIFWEPVMSSLYNTVNALLKWGVTGLEDLIGLFQEDSN